MNRLEAIRGRRSVRAFEPEALKSEDIEKLNAFAEKIENPYGIPVRFKILNAKENGLTSTVIKGAEYYVTAMIASVPHAEEAFGYSFEELVLYAQSLGIGTTIIAGTMDRTAFERASELKDGERMPCVSPLGYPAAKMSTREKMMRIGVKADSRLDFEKLFFSENFDTPLTEEAAGEFATALKMVQLAPSAVNKQPWRVVLKDGKAHFYEKQNGGYVASDGWDLQKIDLGIALCHFAAAIEECGKKAIFAVEDPGIEVPDGVQYIGSYSVC